MQDLAKPDNVEEFESEYAAEGTKYTGPLAIANYEGPKRVNEETGNLMMHTRSAAEGGCENELIGKILFANGSTYSGELKDDMLHGYGIFDDPLGNRYEGPFVDDKREGTNAKFITAYFTYEGDYKNNKRHGKGKETDTKGNIYIGEFKDGVRTFGKNTFVNGDWYEGYFDDEDNFCGKGKYFNAKTGKTEEGIWKDDELVEEE